MAGTHDHPAYSTLPPLPRRGERRDRLRRRLTAILLFVSVVLLVNALVGERGLVATRRARQDATALTAGIAQLRAENAALQEEARRLKEDPTAIERAARRDLGMIRPGEIVVLIKRQPR